MLKKTKIFLSFVLIAGLLMFSVFSLSMVGDLPSKVHASYWEDIMDICLLTNTNIENATINWSEFWLCVATALS